MAIGIHQGWLHTEEGTAGRPWLQGRCAGQRCDHDAASLGLPPSINDGASPLSHHAVVPLPRLRVNGLAHTAQQVQ